MTTFHVEHAADVMAEIKPLLDKHWCEIAHFKDVPLDPDYDAYLLAERRGVLRIFTARTDRLIGYAVFFIGNLHYKTSRIATQDILFLLPEFRGFTGYRLIRFCDEELTKEGIDVIYHHVKLKHDFSPLLIHQGYVAVDTIYARHHHGRNSSGG